MTSRKNIQIVGVNVAKHWHVAGEVFAISDCLVAFSNAPREIKTLQISKTRWKCTLAPDADMSVPCAHPNLNALLTPFAALGFCIAGNMVFPCWDIFQTFRQEFVNLCHYIIVARVTYFRHGFSTYSMHISALVWRCFVPSFNLGIIMLVIIQWVRVIISIVPVVTGEKIAVIIIIVIVVVAGSIVLPRIVWHMSKTSSKWIHVHGNSKKWQIISYFHFATLVCFLKQI